MDSVDNKNRIGCSVKHIDGVDNHESDSIVKRRRRLQPIENNMKLAAGVGQVLARQKYGSRNGCNKWFDADPRSRRVQSRRTCRPWLPSTKLTQL